MTTIERLMAALLLPVLLLLSSSLLAEPPRLLVVVGPRDNVDLARAYIDINRRISVAPRRRC
jgi:hypothetical protein